MYSRALPYGIIVARMCRLLFLRRLAFVVACVTCAAEENLVGYGAGDEQWRGEVTRLMWKPRTFLLKSFLSAEECEHLIRISKPRMGASLVEDAQTGKNRPSKSRTSTGTFLYKNFDNVVGKIERRVAQMTMISTDHQEELQILRYVNGQRYNAHYDFLDSLKNPTPENGGQRCITVLMYLTDVKIGGETVFPHAEGKVEGEGWSDCAKQGFAVHPKKGDAIMFYGLQPDLTPDYHSLHGSCPTYSGEKWSATIWIHVSPLALQARSTS